MTLVRAHGKAEREPRFQKMEGLLGAERVEITRGGSRYAWTLGYEWKETKGEGCRGQAEWRAVVCYACFVTLR